MDQVTVLVRLNYYLRAPNLEETTFFANKNKEKTSRIFVICIIWWIFLIHSFICPSSTSLSTNENLFFLFHVVAVISCSSKAPALALTSTFKGDGARKLPEPIDIILLLLLLFSLRRVLITTLRIIN